MKLTSIILGISALLAATSVPASAQTTGRGRSAQPRVTEGDYVIEGFPFDDGETMPELKLHYRTLGRPRTDANGRTVNAVYIMHGTTGWGPTSWCPSSPSELFGAGQLLDTTKYYVILPDGIGHGRPASPATACTRASRSTATAT